jgi:NAD(P)-dependent dehydrogenase (short-subunit alcohol dehydrogenase family)
MLITGAAGGLGTALAYALASQQARLCLTDLPGAGFDALAQRFPDALRIPLDVTSRASVDSCLTQVAAKWGGLDVLINNAGLVFGGPFEQVPLDRHQTTLAVNLGGPLAVTHAFWPLLTASPDFKIVFIASASGYLPVPHMVSYAASKWALRGLAVSLDEEFRLRGLGKRRVLTVNPSYIGTGLFAGAAPPLLTPLLEAGSVARAVVRGLRTDRRQLDLPWSVGLMKVLARVLPESWFRAFLRFSGVSTSMTGWTGRSG